MLSDSLVLVDFYNATGGPNWTNTWDLSEPISTWYGVFVDSCGVTCLDLDGNFNCNNSIYSGNNLIGSLIELNLPNLRTLYLYSNQLSGSIPSFDNLVNLEYLGLSGNQLNGSIPSFDNLSNLQQLGLSGNQLSGSIPSFDNLVNLQHLGVSWNQLSGRIPSFDNLVNLQALYLDHNQLESASNFQNLTNLMNLHLHNNHLNFTDLLPNTSIPNYQYLSLIHI